jgi:predicted HAD superfamily Cof-like phosphohydrolase
MTQAFEDVKTFMEAAGQECPNDPTGKNQLSTLYGTLIAEEFAEFVTAYFNNNAEKELDACFDMIWVIVGYMHSRGWNIDAAWVEGASSNLSKIDKETGKVVRRHDGKIMKPEGWKEPNFKQFV